MPKVVQIQGYGNVEFPDSMSDDAVNTAIHSQIMRSPEYVAAMKSYIGQKTDAEVASMQPQQPQGSAVGRFLGASVGDTLSGAYNAVRHPIDTAVNAYHAQVDQGKQAANSFSQGDYLSAGGHALAAALPVVGPAAAQAGEEIGSGNVAGGLGHAAALLAPVAAKGVVGALKATPAAGAATDALTQGAKENFYKALNPTTKINKALTENKIAPGLVERGVKATSLEDLKAQADQHTQELGQQIDDIYDQHAAAGTKVNPQPIIDALEKEKQGYTVAGVPINKSYVGTLTDLQDQLKDVSKAHGGDVPLADLRQIRQIHDETVAQSKGGFALDPAGQGAVRASKTFADAIRSTFAQSVPELAPINKEFSFWKDTAKVAGDTNTRRVGQATPLTQRLAQGSGAVLGGHIGGPAGAVVGAEAGLKLARLQNSMLWNSVSASTKSQVAGMIQSGNAAGALDIASKAIMGAAGARSARTNQ